MPPPPPPIVLQQPATQTTANGEHTYVGVLLTKDFDSERLVIINKDEKTKFLMFNNDTRVYLKGDYDIQKLRFSKQRQTGFQLMIKMDSVLDEIKNAISLKMGGTPVGYYSDPKFGMVWPFVKTYQNLENETCVLANLDGKEQLVCVESINNKTMGIIPILKVGGIKFHNVKKKWCIGLTLDEVKLESNVCEIVKEPPKLKFANFL